MFNTACLFGQHDVNPCTIYYPYSLHMLYSMVYYLSLGIAGDNLLTVSSVRYTMIYSNTYSLDMYTNNIYKSCKL